jgi:hypothetical protein
VPSLPQRATIRVHLALDRRRRPQWHRIGGAVWRGDAAGEKREDLVGQKAQPQRHHVTAAMAVLVRKVETQRLQQVRCSRARVIAT